jgi:hypothetical protein
MPVHRPVLRKKRPRRDYSIWQLLNVNCQYRLILSKAGAVAGRRGCPESLIQGCAHFQNRIRFD